MSGLFDAFLITIGVILGIIAAILAIIVAVCVIVVVGLLLFATLCVVIYQLYCIVRRLSGRKLPEWKSMKKFLEESKS